MDIVATHRDQRGFLLAKLGTVALAETGTIIAWAFAATRNPQPVQGATFEVSDALYEEAQLRGGEGAWDRLQKYSAKQPRDHNGRWTEGGWTISDYELQTTRKTDFEDGIMVFWEPGDGPRYRTRFADGANINPMDFRTGMLVDLGAKGAHEVRQIDHELKDGKPVLHLYGVIGQDYGTFPLDGTIKVAHEKRPSRVKKYAPLTKYAPGQPRDRQGQFASTAGGTALSSTAAPPRRVETIEEIDARYAREFPEAAAKAKRDMEFAAKVRSGGTETARMASKVESDKYDGGESDLLYMAARKADRAVNADHKLPAGFADGLEVTSSSQYLPKTSTTLGYYNSGDSRIWIKANRYGDEESTTILHEMGHRLDHLLAIKHNSGYTFESQDATGWDPDNMGDGFPAEDNPWGKFRTAVEGTEAWKKVLAHPNKRRSRYLQEPTEVLARAYSQYVRTQETTPFGLRFGDERDHDGVREGSQWAPEEFGPVAAAIEGILKSEGLK